MDKIVIALAAILFFVISLVGFTALVALPVMWLWNYTCPDLFHLPHIDFWHAWALLLLAGLLVKGGTSSKT